MLTIIGDFGGTNARLALSTEAGIRDICEYKCESFEGPEDVIAHYCIEVGRHPRNGIFAIAGNAADPSNIVFTNGPWKQRPLDYTDSGIEQVTTLNDFAAVCYAVGKLTPDDCKTLVEGEAPFFPAGHMDMPMLVGRVLESPPEQRFVTVGPGTGLGVGSGFVTTYGQFMVAGGEGGHTAFAPATREEFNLKQLLKDTHNIVVTHETIASGAGLVKVFNGLSHLRGLNVSINQPGDLKVILDAQSDLTSTAKDTMAVFARTLGTAASSAALVNNARTVFVAGGVIPKLGDHFDCSAFAEGLRKNDLGINNFMEKVPALLITHEQPGLLGCHVRAQL